MSNERYLGDGVYVEIERGMAKLTTKDSPVRNTIYLEPEVMIALIQWFTQTFNPEIRVDGEIGATVREEK